MIEIELGVRAAMWAASRVVRTVVFAVGVIGGAADPLPPDDGPQVPRVASVNEGWEPVGTEQDRLRLATVTVETDRGKGSGVCIHPAGFVLTVEHVASRGECQVHFVGREPIQGTVVQAKIDGHDAASLISCPGEQLPFVPVASSSPDVGDSLTGVGIHKGNYVALSGAMQSRAGRSTGLTDHRGRSFLQFEFSSLGGMSGGPVVNASGEVVSLITNMDVNGWVSYGVPTENLQEVASHAPALPAQATSGNNLPQMEIWWANGCPPCRQFRSHFAEGSSSRKKLEQAYSLDWKNFETYHAEATRKGITSVPTFYVPSEDRMLVGYDYQSADEFLECLNPDGTASFGQGIESEPTPAGKPDVSDSSESESDDPDGLIARLIDGALGAIATWILMGPVNWFYRWRAEQGFIKRRIIDRTVSKATSKAEARAEETPTGRAAMRVAKTYLKKGR